LELLVQDYDEPLVLMMSVQRFSFLWMVSGNRISFDY